MDNEVILQIKLPVSYFTLESVLSGCSEKLDQECNLMVDLYDEMLTIYMRGKDGK